MLKDNNRPLSLLHNTSWSAFGSITNTVGRMAIVIILARRLGPESFGVYVFVQWLIDMTFLLFSVGLGGVATRFFPQNSGKEADKIPGFNRWFFRTGAFAILLASCFAAISVFEFTQLRNLAVIAAVLLLTTTSSAYALLSARAQGLFQYKLVAASSALLVIGILTGLALPLGKFGLFVVLVVMGVANLLAGALLAIYTRSSMATTCTCPMPLGKAHSAQIFQFATNTWVTSFVASLVWARGELPLVKSYLGETEVGYYAIGLTLSGLINHGLGLLTGALWPYIAREWDSGNREELLRFSCVVTNLLMLVAGVAAGFVICFAPYIVTLLFSDKFLPSSNLVLIFAVGALGLTSGSAHLVVHVATNGRFARNVTFVGGVSLFVAAFALIPRFGIEGAAAARTVTQIGIAILTFVWLGKVFHHSTDTRHNLRSFILLILLAVSLMVVIQNVGPNMQIWSLSVLFVTYCSIICLICSRGWGDGMINEFRKLSGVGDA